MAFDRSTKEEGVTLAGTPDYITISGQAITRNQIVLTTDVSGILPVANGGTALTSLSTLLNSNVTPTSLSLVIGTNVQAYDAQLDTLAGFTAAQVTRGNSDGNLLTANDVVADNDWLRIDGTEVEGRSDAEIKADLSLEIGTDVQAYDGDTAKTDTAQAWTLPQRTALLTDNDGNFDLSAKQNFFCTPGTARELTFTTPADGQSGFVKLVNAGAYSHTAHANTKINSDDLSAIGAAGTFLLGYLSDGTNTWVTVSKSLLV